MPALEHGEVCISHCRSWVKTGPKGEALGRTCNTYQLFSSFTFNHLVWDLVVFLAVFIALIISLTHATDECLKGVFKIAMIMLGVVLLISLALFLLLKGPCSCLALDSHVRC